MMQQQDRILTARQMLCCHWYALTGNAEEAAARCWASRENQKQAALWLRTPEAQNYLDTIRAAGKREPGVQEGYRRLAFGSVADAVKLMFAPEDAPPVIDGLDLFNISELRRTKGGLEISFFDRLDALDRLAQQQAAEQHDAPGFYEAIRAGAAALGAEE